MDYHTTAFNDYGQPFKITEAGELTRITERAFEDRFYPHITPRIKPGAPATFESDSTVHGNVGVSIDALGHRTTYTYAWGAVAPSPPRTPRQRSASIRTAPSSTRRPAPW